MAQGFKEFAVKHFGYFDLGADEGRPAPEARYNEAVKVAYIKAGGTVVIDFKEYNLEHDALFFVSEAQHFNFGADSTGTIIYYNRDFYCVEIHDHEVACDGILFRNVYEIPVVYLKPEQSVKIAVLIDEIKEEIQADESGMEEMLRILLKRIIIKATRIWKNEHQLSSEEVRQEVEFLRRFSQMVDQHYTTRHTVSEYADLLNITPKALNKRITRHSSTTPNDIIKNRIILEAKRLLAHTSLSVKEIGYKLGYDDPNYFTRLFNAQTQSSPQNFRVQYQRAV